MRCVTLALAGAVLLSVPSLPAQEKPPAASQVAIGDAIRFLQKAAAAETNPLEKARLRVAIKALESLRAVPIRDDNDLVPTLADDPMTLIGKTLTLTATVNIKAAGVNLRQLVGRQAAFVVQGGGARVELTLNLPDDLAVPNVGGGEEVLITFECKDGLRTIGNVAKSVRRIDP